MQHLWQASAEEVVLAEWLLRVCHCESLAGTQQDRRADIESWGAVHDHSQHQVEWAHRGLFRQ